jgi:hypothetical protein
MGNQGNPQALPRRFRRLIVFAAVLFVGVSLAFWADRAIVSLRTDETKEAVTAEDQAAKFDGNTDDRSTAAIDARIDAIKAELSTLGKHPWAGEYFESVGGHLWIAPDAGVVYSFSGCQGVYDQNMGTVTAHESELKFTWELPMPGSELKKASWLVIPSEAYVFLTPVHDIHQFCLAVRGLRNSPLNTFASQNHRIKNRLPLVRLDETRGIRLPERFEKYLNLDPIEAKVLSVDTPVRRRSSDEVDIITQDVVIDAGEDKHLFPGMWLAVKQPTRSPLGILRVVEVRQNEATAKVEYPIARENPANPVQPGWVFHTPDF